ncbi:MAG: hypothetical protein ACYC1K_00215 [Minisyncoccota bacterium]
MYYVSLPLEMQLVDGKSGLPRVVRAGTYLMERIPNPLYPGQFPWLVIKGSKIGLAEAYFWELEAEKIPVFRVKISPSRTPHI